MNISLRTIVVAGGLVTVASLLPAGAVWAQAPAHEPTTIAVKNTRNVPVEVFLDQEAFDVRLGTVAPNAEKTLPLPPYEVERGDLRIFVHPEGGRDLETPFLDPAPGGQLKILVPPNDAGFIPAPPPEVIPDPGVDGATVTLQNDRAQPVTLYVERGDFDVRLGTVPANREVTLAIPPWLARDDQSVELFVHPEHGMDLASQLFALTPRAHLLVKVRPG